MPVGEAPLCLPRNYTGNALSQYIDISAVAAETSDHGFACFTPPSPVLPVNNKKAPYSVWHVDIDDPSSLLETPSSWSAWFVRKGDAFSFLGLLLIFGLAVVLGVRAHQAALDKRAVVVSKCLRWIAATLLVGVAIALEFHALHVLVLLNASEQHVLVTLDGEGIKMGPHSHMQAVVRTGSVHLKIAKEDGRADPITLAIPPRKITWDKAVLRRLFDDHGLSQGGGELLYSLLGPQPFRLSRVPYVERR